MHRQDRVDGIGKMVSIKDDSGLVNRVLSEIERPILLASIFGKSHPLDNSPKAPKGVRIRRLRINSMWW